MDYYDVSIKGSLAVYKVIQDDGSESFVDANGEQVKTPEEPIRYNLLSWCIKRPVWMEPLLIGA